MPKIVLVNPSDTSPGYSFITPRWQFVIAGATPVELLGEPILKDEALERFDARTIEAGDIVGIGISTGNCLAGYRVAREAKSRGATVVMGGIHTTIFPDEPLEMGADAVVTGNGDVLWPSVIRDALQRKLRKRYDGGRVAGDALCKARWDLVDPRRYLFPSVQTLAGCPENCSFCSVWVTDGRRPRLRRAAKVIEEVTELYDLGFRFVIFADDNFTPATLGRIAREPSPEKRREFERLRQERLEFFDQYDRAAPKGIFGCTQMTAEAVSDPEYLSAMYHKMRIRQALIGVESYSAEGLASANKRWNPAGEEMMDAIRRIQAAGIVVLSSLICGLESDTMESISTSRQFALDSGAAIAQFTVYNPYPGTKDYYEMVTDRRNAGKPGYTPRHRSRLLYDRFWLMGLPHAYVVRHANMTSAQLIVANRKCWDAFYSPREVLRRIRTGMPARWSAGGRLAYFIASLTFRRIYASHGVAADSVRKENMGLLTRLMLKLSIGVYSVFYQWRRLRLSVRIAQKPAAGLRFQNQAVVQISNARSTEAAGGKRSK
jgi:radical SAM superfamily enzyme YgiQ (UPF0313 family)